MPPEMRSQVDVSALCKIVMLICIAEERGGGEREVKQRKHKFND